MLIILPSIKYTMHFF